jgi:hypothetical protein
MNIEKVYINRIGEKNDKIPAIVVDYKSVVYFDNTDLYNYSLHADSLCSYMIYKRHSKKPIDYIAKDGENLIKELVDYSRQAANNAVWGDKKYPKKNIR